MSYPMGPNRYRLVRLASGQIYAVDNTNAAKAYLLTSRPASRMRYALARGGEIAVERGRLTGVVGGEARASGYAVFLMSDGSVRLVDSQRRELTVSRVGGMRPPGRFAVLDARDGTLLLLDERGLHELTVTPTPPLDEKGGQPIYQYADDFAP